MAIDHWDECPWSQQSRETDRAYAAFGIYRDFGVRRSLRKAAGRFYGLGDHGGTTAKVRQFETWSSRNGWVARAHAFDRYVETERYLERIEAIKAMEDRHVQIALAMQRKGLDRLAVLPLEEISASVLIRMIVMATTLERQALGFALATSQRSLELGLPPEVAVSPRQEPTNAERMAAIVEALIEAGVVFEEEQEIIPSVILPFREQPAVGQARSA